MSGEQGSKSLKFSGSGTGVQKHFLGNRGKIKRGLGGKWKQCDLFHGSRENRYLPRRASFITTYYQNYAWFSACRPDDADRCLCIKHSK